MSCASGPRTARPDRRPRVMARPPREVDRRRGGRGSRDNRFRLAVAAIATLVVTGLTLATLGGLPPSTAQQNPTPAAGRSAQPTAWAGVPSHAVTVSSPPATPTTGRSTQPPTTAVPAGTAEPARTVEPARTPESTATAMPSPTAARHPQAAPVRASEFNLEAQVIEILFPLKETARYRYRDNFGDPRDGLAEGYNHAHSRSAGEILRAHDGIDIYAATGTAVVAPFDGVVIDPSARWKPWIPDRYGRTAAILSAEPTSEGYTALLTHLDVLYVEPGQQVHRGEVVGTAGDSGNAEGGRPHLHFELRAPFPLRWTQLGERRLVDAFNPYPSLLAADPRRN